MSRVKWNLDQLKEVQKQQEIAMTATEQVINDARNDLNSMTEEVWEGEDGDMARELLGELVYKEMPQTWKEIDAINTAIKKAQKTANESKNFCNEFSQIFKDGSLPSETDSAECSGELLCDTGSCDLLKAAMGAAGKNAVNVKRNIETVENILSELETPEAKFDYTSYTGPIKEQAQNVTDRTMMFNNAVSRYESKVKEMDETLARELMEAIPGAVPVRFDPSILLNKDIIHMKDGDIVSWLKAHQKINIADNMGLAHAQSNIKSSSENQKPDLSDVTNNQASNVNVTTVKTTNNNTTPTTPDQNIVDFYNSLPKEIQEVLGDTYEEYSQYISYTDDGFYYINKPLSEIMSSADGINEKTKYSYTNDKGELCSEAVGDNDERYIVALKNADGTYTYTLVKIRPEVDSNGDKNARAGTAISFSEFDIDSLAESMRNGKINDDLEASLMACIHGLKVNDKGKVVTADASDKLIDYFSDSSCQANYLIADIAIKASLESPLYNKETGEYKTEWKYDQFDSYCRHRLDELKKTGVVEIVGQKVILHINEEDGLSQDEIDALMCVTTGSPTLLCFGAETQYHAIRYSQGIMRSHAIIADAGVTENANSWAPEESFKRYYTEWLAEGVEDGPGKYVAQQENAFGDKAYEYIEGYSK
jgi:hypothetical protein